MKVIILGATGMIGHRVWWACSENKNLETVGVTRKFISNEPILSFMAGHKIYDGVDVNNFGKLTTILDNEKPDWIINAIGVTIRKKEIENIDYALQINSFLPRRLEKWGQRNNCKLIHFSTDCVFSGSEGGYDETSNPTASDIYGKTKFFGEVTDSNSITMRFSCIGRELFAHTELLEWFLSQNGKGIKGFTKAMYSGVTTITIAREVINILTNHKSLSGLYQLSSHPISKYDLLQLAKAHFQVETEITPTDSYVSDKTLICRKYQIATGFQIPHWHDLMAELASDKSIQYL